MIISAPRLPLSTPLKSVQNLLYFLLLCVIYCRFLDFCDIIASKVLYLLIRSVKLLMIDILEQELSEISEKLFNILLLDRTTRKNICWATDQYMFYGDAYHPQEPITRELITGFNTRIIKPRVSRTTYEQNYRTKRSAEVFTPSWICNEQNNLIDEEWFGRKSVFNVAKSGTWTATKEKIVFPQNKSWQNYVDAKRLEISCGEAPYLVSRYDTVTGEEVPITERVGLLDRKLRIVNENTDNETDWFKWVKRAYESTYGYEYQGDNLLIARENLLYTFIENMVYKFQHKPNSKQLEEIAKIISWNIWQMDGITMTVPFSERPCASSQIKFMELIWNVQPVETEPIPCKIFDWRSKKSLEFKSMINRGKKQ